MWTLFGLAVFPLGVALATAEIEIPAFARAIPVAGGTVILLAGALRLRLRKSDDEGQAALLAGQSHEALYQASRTKAGINKNIGWHTFRHSFGTLLKANGEDVKTVQELLRHANSRITLDVYTQAVNSNKRAAQSKVVRMMVSNVGQKREEKYPQTGQ